MARKPFMDKHSMKKGAWSPEEDDKLKAYIHKYGHWNWRELPRFAGLSRCSKSCRLRWMNYLRPNLKRGNYTAEEEDTIIKLREKYGNKRMEIIAHNYSYKRKEEQRKYMKENLHTDRTNTSSGSKDQESGGHTQYLFHLNSYLLKLVKYKLWTTADCQSCIL